jgi:hypothetical protein
MMPAHTVIPAHAGIQVDVMACSHGVMSADLHSWIPARAGMTDMCA